MSGTHFSGPVYPMAGGIPATFGKTYFVDPVYGSDDGEGLSMGDAFATLAHAYDATETDRNDVIVLTGHTAHTLTDELAVSKNRVHFVGLGGGSRYLGQRSRVSMGVTTGTAIAAVKITGVGCTFENIKFSSADTLGTSLYTVADGGEFTQFSHCSFEKSLLLSTTGAAELLCNADTGYYYRCSFGNLIYQVTAARQNVKFNRETITGKVARDVIFEDCLFMVKTSSADARHLYGSGATDIERMLWLNRCTFWTAKLSAATQTCAITFGAAQTQGTVLLQDCVSVGPTGITVTGGVAVGIFTNSPTPAAAGPEAVQTAAA